MCDMIRALLEVSNPKFFDGLKPLQFVDTPSLQNTVVVFVRTHFTIVRIAPRVVCASDVRSCSDLTACWYHRAIPRAARAFAQHGAWSRVWNCNSTRSCGLSR